MGARACGAGGETSGRVMGRDARPELPLWAWEARHEEEDCIGPEKDSAREHGAIAEAAQRLRAWAARYAERYLGDRLQGEEILADVARDAIAAASSVNIERPESYLLRGVVRRVRRLLSRTPPIDYVGSVPDLDALKESRVEQWVNESERHLLIQEIIALMDDQTRRIHLRRARGDSWNQIGANLGISPDAARERLRHGLEKVKAKIAGSHTTGDSQIGAGRHRPADDPSQLNRK